MNCKCKESLKKAKKLVTDPPAHTLVVRAGENFKVEVSSKEDKVIMTFYDFRHKIYNSSCSFSLDTHQEACAFLLEVMKAVSRLEDMTR